MSRGGAALLGGLLIGGLVVGAAAAADRQDRRNYATYNRQQPIQQRPTYCICGAQMVQGRVQQGAPKCNNMNCQKLLAGNIMFYCPNGGKIQMHKKGFFYCTQCANQLKRGGQVQRIVQQPQPQQPRPVPIKQQQQQSCSNNNGYPANTIKYSAPVVVKEGYMSKKGTWFNHAFKKRYFKLYSNKKMSYLEHPNSTHTKGYADLSKIKKMEKKSNNGLEITTQERVWTFLCISNQDRENWFNIIQNVCMGIKPKVQYIQQPPQPQIKYVQQPPKPQVIYKPQPQPIQPKPQYIQPQPQIQPQYAQPSKPINQSNIDKGPGFEPGMSGYNGGNMYGSNSNDIVKSSVPSSPFNASSIPSAPSAPSYPNLNQLNNGNDKQWENNAPPPAYTMPSAPPMEDEGN